MGHGGSKSTDVAISSADDYNHRALIRMPLGCFAIDTSCTVRAGAHSGGEIVII
jgi:hypothetical protein